MFKILFIVTLNLLLVASKLASLFLRPNPKKGSVLYLAAWYPGNAGYHWRVAKWAELLIKEGYIVEIKVAANENYLNQYDSKPYRFLLSFMMKRFFQCLEARNYETVIVRRELLPFNDYGDHFLEKCLVTLCENVVLDIDDDLSAAKRQPRSVKSLFGKMLYEDGNSFRNSLKYYKGFYVASEYLKQYVHTYSNISVENIQVIPTCVDYLNYPKKEYCDDEKNLNLGWIGGDHNYFLLKNIIPELEKLAETYKFKLVIIGGDKFPYPTHLEVEHYKWSLESEVQLLYNIDIGLMPLNDTRQSKGKGGFKLIQYMGLGIIGVASAVTINVDIVNDQEDGFLVHNNDWYSKLMYVIEQRSRFSTIGDNARIKIQHAYSFDGNAEKYKRLLLSNN